MKFGVSMRHLTSFLLTVLLAGVSCRNDSVKLSGRIDTDCPSDLILELVNSTGPVAVDTIRTDKKGIFNIKIVPPYDGPNLYSLNMNDYRIPLLLSAGEKVFVALDSRNPADYRVEGSDESQLVAGLKHMMDAGTMTLDSLLTLAHAASGDRQQLLLKQYAADYARLKRRQIEFIVANAGSMAAVYALYQHFPFDEVLGGQDNDVVYYRLVADSVQKHYPNSPYLAAVNSYIRSVDSGAELLRMIGESIDNPSSYPDISLPDMYGNSHRLSELHGKVILLDFWSAGSDAAAIRNAELKHLYEKYHMAGFEIFQVGLNSSKKDWLNAVQMQQLPWISVCDFKGFDSYAARIYNISAADNFIIDSDGEIIAHTVNVERLRDILNQRFAAVSN